MELYGRSGDGMVKENGLYILAHDLGTTGNKSCIYRLGEDRKSVV